MLNRALEAAHLGYEKGDPAGRGSGNNRNGATTKRVGWFPNTPVRSRLSALPLSGRGLCGAVRVRLLEQNLSLLQR